MSHLSPPKNQDEDLLYICFEDKIQSGRDDVTVVIFTRHNELGKIQSLKLRLGKKRNAHFKNEISLRICKKKKKKKKKLFILNSQKGNNVQMIKYYNIDILEI